MDFEDHQNDLAADLSAAIANDLASGILIPDDPLDEEVSSYNLSDVSTYNLSDVSTYNLSDVLDVIQHQQEQEVITLEGVNSMFPTNNGDAGAGPSAQAQQQNQQQHQFRQPAERTPSNSSSHRSHSKRQQAYVEILEQPAPKSLRFRYECEGRSAGSIPGVRNTPETKTYPSIRVVGYKGDAFVVVSCVTKDFPYKPHPHNLVGKDCKTGVCTVRITDESMTITFSNLGIQCVKKKDVEQHLKQREEIKVDPFKTGFSHRNQPSSIDLNAVRLCFQVFVNGPNGLTALQPVVSEPIFDKKAMSELVICKLSDCSSPITGGKDIILLCEKVAKEDIAVRFYEEKEGQVVWEANGEFQHSNVHKQVAISFRTPAYRSLDISHMVKVFIQLKRPSDGCVSDPLPFDYLPLDSGRRSFWAMRRELCKKYNLPISNLSNDDHQSNQVQPFAMENDDRGVNNHNHINNNTEPQPTITITDNCVAINRDENDAEREENVIVLDTPTADECKNIVCEDAEIEPVVALVTTTTQDDEQGQSNLAEAIEQMNYEEKTNEWIRSTEFDQDKIVPINQNTEIILNQEMNLENDNNNNTVMDEDKTLTELLDQVAELDEIYTDHQIRRNMLIENELSCLDNSLPKTKNLEEDQMDIDDIFDDAATYSSLQKAFKNPVVIPMDPVVPLPSFSTISPTYDAVVINNPPGPMIDIGSLKRESKCEEEKLPPLPPKRKKPPTSETESPSSNKENKQQEDSKTVLSDSESLGLGSNFTNSRRSSQRSITPRPPSQIIIMRTPEPGQQPPSKKLPPTPSPMSNSNKSSSTGKLNQKVNSSNTLPKQKKSGFFSKLFSRRKSKSDLADSKSADNINREANNLSPDSADSDFLLHPNRFSSRSLKVPTPVGNKAGKPVGRSVSSVSGKRPHLTPDIIHIPLKGDSTNSLPMHGDSNPNLSHFHHSVSNRNISSYELSPNMNLDHRKTMSALQLADLPLQDGNMELIAIADAQSLKNLCEGQYGVQLDPSVDLTEAEHYALYTSMAPLFLR